MFTGLIETVGSIIALESNGVTARLKVNASFSNQVKVGDSISVNGVCLTAVEVGTYLTFEAVAETLNRSSLGDLVVGSNVNLERALAVGDRLGGHYVQGHVDGTIVLQSTEKVGDGNVLTFIVPANLRRYIVEKGSVAVDGISLTVSAVSGTTFSVWIVPHTQTHTNLGERKPGDRLNLEVDILAKYTERLLKGQPVRTEVPRTTHGN